MSHFSGVMGAFYIMLCWSGLYFGIKYYQQLQEQTQQTLKATAAAHQAQLKMLRYQLNPHFLFNTPTGYRLTRCPRTSFGPVLAESPISD